jgi:hypothetical protein
MQVVAVGSQDGTTSFHGIHVHGMLHSLHHAGRASVLLTELRGKSTKLVEGERHKLVEGGLKGKNPILPCKKGHLTD